MLLMIDPPVSVFSSIDAVLAWKRELAVMREQYRDDPQALRYITSADDDARELLTLIPTLPPLPSFEQLVESWVAEVSKMDLAALEHFSHRINKKYRRHDLAALNAAIATRRRVLGST
jgi:hypothetical protein